jgi:hypothetical protein
VISPNFLPDTQIEPLSRISTSCSITTEISKSVAVIRSAPLFRASILIFPKNRFLLGKNALQRSDLFFSLLIAKSRDASLHSTSRTRLVPRVPRSATQLKLPSSSSGTKTLESLSLLQRGLS